MELWIRSQDKKRLTTVNDLRVCYRLLNKEKKEWFIEDCDWLGTYKSEERALKVLDEIKDILETKMVYKNITEDKESIKKINKMFPNCHHFDTTNMADIHFINDTYVYQMPKE